MIQLHCTSQNFYPETIHFRSHSPLKYFIQVSTSSILFSIFIKSCIFFSIYTILNKSESGTIQVDQYYPFKKMIHLCQKHKWFELRCIFQQIKKFQIKISYNINNAVLSKTLDKFWSKAFFFYFKYFLKTWIKNNMG